MGLSGSAIALYRMANWAYRRRIPLVPRILYIIAYFVYRASVPPSCTIGPGTKLGYGGFGVFLNPTCRIGSRCYIATDVVITGSFGTGAPVIGDNVWISSGTRILGDVVVGNNVIIGANSVVLRSIPDNCVVSGSPARVIRPLGGELDAPNGKLIRGGARKAAAQS